MEIRSVRVPRIPIVSLPLPVPVFVILLIVRTVAVLIIIVLIVVLIVEMLIVNVLKIARVVRIGWDLLLKLGMKLDPQMLLIELLVKLLVWWLMKHLILNLVERLVLVDEGLEMLELLIGPLTWHLALA